MASCLKLVQNTSYYTRAWIALGLFELTGVVVIGITGKFESGATLQCNPDKTIASDTSERKFINTDCFEKYKEEFHPFLPLYVVCILNFLCILAISVIYACFVNKRVKTFAEPPRQTANGGDEESQPLYLSPAAINPKTRQSKKRYFVSTVYVLHLIIGRILPLGIFAGLLLNSTEFPSQFDCPWSKNSMSTLNVNATQPQGRNVSIVDCIYPTGSKDKIMSATVITINLIFGTGAIIELACLLWSSRKDRRLWCDEEFCCVYLLEKRKTMKKIIDNIIENVLDDVFYLHDIFGGASPRRKLDDFYINRVVIIQDIKENRDESYQKHLEETSDLFEHRDIPEQHPKTILVVGRGGIGKTFLTEKIFHEWYKQESEFWRGKIVILLKFLDFKQRTTNLPEMLEHAHGLNMSPADFHSIYEYIVLNSRKVVFIFDGFDELGYNKSKLPEVPALNNPNEKRGILQIFMQLITGTLFPGATVVITSRPTAEHLYKQLRFHREVEILDFDKEQIKSYVEKFCGNDKEKSSRLWNSIDETPELLSLSYIPLNCSIICSTLKETIDDVEEDEGESSQSNVPRTMTELYKRATEKLNFSQRGKYKGEPPLDGTLHGKLEHDGLPIMIQEFLAAQHVVDDMEHVESFLIEHINIPEWHLVIQFVAGLIGDKIREIKKKGNASKRSDEEIKNDKITKSICERFQNWMPKLGKINGEKPGDYRKLLVIKCVHEMQEVNDLMTLISYDKFVLKNLSIPPVDSAALFAFFRQIKNLQFLHIDHCNMRSSAYRELANLLDKDNKIKDLRMENCGISDDDAKHIINALRHGKCEVTSLVLAGNNLTGESAKYLCDTLTKSGNCKLTKLNLDRNKLNDANRAVYLRTALESNKWELKSLSICGNELTDESAECLNDALQSGTCKLTELTISDNKLTDNWTESFSGALMSGKCQLVKCDIRDNEFTDNSAEYLGEAVKSDNCKLEALDISSKELSNTATKFFCDALKSTKCKLTRLGISGNKLTEESARYLRDLMKSDNCNLTALSVRNCNLTNKSAKYFSEALGGGDSCKLTELDISDNELSDDGIHSFSHVLTTKSCELTRLDITHNQFTEKSAEYFKDLLKNNMCNLTELCMSSCKLTSEDEKYFEGALESSSWKLTGNNKSGIKLTKLVRLN